MANGYIGKISAIVTANTSDLSRKLSGAVGDVDKFANKLNASITRSANAAGASFDKIFTPLQKLERQFAAGLEFNLRTEKQVLQLRQLVSASEQVAKPLERAAQQTTKLCQDFGASSFFCCCCFFCCLALLLCLSRCCF